MVNVSKWNYGNYSSSNYGYHTTAIRVNGLQLYFSYDTVVAFSTPGNLRVRENVWGPTTGKHLNWIDGGNTKTRLSSDEFEKALAEVLKTTGVIIN